MKTFTINAELKHEHHIGFETVTSDDELIKKIREKREMVFYDIGVQGPFQHLECHPGCPLIAASRDDDQPIVQVYNENGVLLYELATSTNNNSNRQCMMAWHPTLPILAVENGNGGI